MRSATQPVRKSTRCRSRARKCCARCARPRSAGVRRSKLELLRPDSVEDPAAALLALGAQLRTTARVLPLAQLYRLPTDDDRNVTALESGELILELDVPQPEASVYLKAMDRRKWSFAIVGVAAARFSDGVKLALAGVAPVPWALSSPDVLEQATPLPGTAYKLDIARALIRRAIEAIGAPAGN